MSATSKRWRRRSATSAEPGFRGVLLAPRMAMTSIESESAPSGFPGLDLLSSAVILLDGRMLIRHLNPAAENLFAVSLRTWQGRSLTQLVGTGPFVFREYRDGEYVRMSRNENFWLGRPGK